MYKAQRRLHRSHEKERAKNFVAKDPGEKIENLSNSESQLDDEYAESQEVVESDEETETEKDSKIKIPTELISIADSDSIRDLDSDRIIDPNSDLSYSTLYQYVPATKLKGIILPQVLIFFFSLVR